MARQYRSCRSIGRLQPISRLRQRFYQLQIVNGDVSNDTLWVDDEQTSQGDTFFFDQDTIVSGQRVVGVSQQWNVDWAQTTFLSWDIGPCQKGVFGVSGGERT